MVSQGATVATDERLVAAVREGSDQAFEALFGRYRERITAHVRGMVNDRGRAEDIVQEAFIAALHGLRATDQEIAFRPWIHQIARNACIDHLRQVGRTEEISIDSEDFLPDFEIRISRSPLTDTRVLQRQELDDLRQAFRGLPDSQYEILVLRELQGLSYNEIGRRMRLTPAAVESMLWRARRTLKRQYDEIATGERCGRMQSVIAAAAGGLAGKRDRRALERHVRHCRRCRQEALLMGLEQLVADAQRRSRLSSALSDAAGLLPFPALFRRRLDDVEKASGTGASHLVNAHATLSNLGAVGGVGADQAASALQKAAAVVAVAAVAGGGGYAARHAGVPLPLPKPLVIGKSDASTKTPTDAAGSISVPRSTMGTGGISAPSTTLAPGASEQPASVPSSAPTLSPRIDSSSPTADATPTDTTGEAFVDNGPIDSSGDGAGTEAVGPSDESPAGAGGITESTGEGADTGGTGDPSAEPVAGDGAIDNSIVDVSGSGGAGDPSAQPPVDDPPIGDPAPADPPPVDDNAPPESALSA
jgi:RNA polymerase sigma factor (sigma-70 family)